MKKAFPCHDVVKRWPALMENKCCHCHFRVLRGPLTRYGWRMRQECRERFPLTDIDMHHGTCVTHVPWCTSGSLTIWFLGSWCRRKLSQHSRACATLNFPYLVRGPWPIWKKRHMEFETWESLEMFILLQAYFGCYHLINKTSKRRGGWERSLVRYLA